MNQSMNWLLTKKGVAIKLTFDSTEAHCRCCRTPLMDRWKPGRVVKAGPTAGCGLTSDTIQREREKLASEWRFVLFANWQLAILETWKRRWLSRRCETEHLIFPVNNTNWADYRWLALMDSTRAESKFNSTIIEPFKFGKYGRESCWLAVWPDSIAEIPVTTAESSEQLAKEPKSNMQRPSNGLIDWINQVNWIPRVLLSSARCYYRFC